MKTIIFTTLALLAIIPAAYADDDSASCTTEPQSSWMSEQDITAKAIEAGYKDVKQVKTAGTCYEVYAFTAKGDRAEIYMNPVTGEVSKAEIDE